MLPAPARIRRSADFALAVRRGRRSGTRLLVVHLLVPDPVPESPSPSGTDALPTAQPRPTPAPARVGLVVSRAVGSAVVRNQVKRRLRALARDRLDRLPAGALLVVRANADAARASSGALALELDRALDRALHRGRDRALPRAGHRGRDAADDRARRPRGTS